MQIKDIMTRNPETLTEETSVFTVAEVMAKYGVGAVPITEAKSRRLTGIITDRDIVTRCVSRNLNPNAVTAKEIMTSGAECVCPENSVTETARKMAKKQVRRLPVCQNGRVVGIISLGDISRSKLLFAETASAFCDICEDRKE